MEPSSFSSRPTTSDEMDKCSSEPEEHIIILTCKVYGHFEVKHGWSNRQLWTFCVIGTWIRPDTCFGIFGDVLPVEWMNTVHEWHEPCSCHPSWPETSQWLWTVFFHLKNMTCQMQTLLNLNQTEPSFHLASLIFHRNSLFIQRQPRGEGQFDSFSLDQSADQLLLCGLDVDAVRRRNWLLVSSKNSENIMVFFFF